MELKGGETIGRKESPKYLEDISGQRFGRLTAVRVARNFGSGHCFWLCKCDCGNETEVEIYGLLDGNTQSCGCIHHEMMLKKNTTHGDSGTPLYNSWLAMRQRCYYDKHDMYKLYGERGITVCDEWVDNYESFRDWALAHGYEAGLSIDRIDCNGNYEPSNCRWATSKQQGNNTRRNHYIEYDGKRMTLSEAAELYGIPYHTLKARFNVMHWSAEKALTYPVREKEHVYHVNGNALTTNDLASQYGLSVAQVTAIYHSQGKDKCKTLDYLDMQYKRKK